jgi:hypothetical protein
MPLALETDKIRLLSILQTGMYISSGSGMGMCMGLVIEVLWTVRYFLGVFINYEIGWRMASSGMLHRVALVRTDVSEELSAPIIRVTRIGELGTLAVTRLLVTANAIPSPLILVTLMMEVLSSSETSGAS